MMRIRTYLFFTMFILFCLSLFSLETQKGNLKLVLHEGRGKFSLYATAFVPEEKEIPLFVDDDPGTSSLSILYNNTIYKMGESSRFKEQAEITDTGAKFVWTSPLLKVTQDFIFLDANDSPLAEGIKIIITIKNESENDAQIGARVLFDTFLGEKSDTHFMTESSDLIAKEKMLKGDSIGQFWISPVINSTQGDGLIVFTDSKYVTVPDEIIFANWKRLVETTWSYTVNSSKGFSFHPYSFNDSAVSQYYNPVLINKGAGRSVTLILGNSSSFENRKSSYIAKTDTSKNNDNTTTQDKANIADSASSNNTGSFGAILKSFTQGNYDVVQQEVAYINKLIEDMNQKMIAGEKITDEELERYRLMVKEILARAEK